MIVTRENFSNVIAELKTHKLFALDTETTGLKAYQGDRLFSLIITVSEKDSKDPASNLTSFYFNFWRYPDGTPVLEKAATFAALQDVFSGVDSLWYIHNAKFDMSMLLQEGVEISGTIHCTRSGARLERNDHFKYDLASCAERIHLAKDDRVEKYIEEHHLWEWEIIRGKKSDKKKKFYYKVPFAIISEYGCTDAEVCFRLGCHQEREIEKFSEHIRHYLPSRPLLRDVLANERELTKTVFQIERVGVRIDRPYCQRALAFEQDRMQKGILAYKRETGLQYKSSNLDFQKVFQEEKDKWVWGEPTKTGKVNPSFESDVLKHLSHPAARIILDIRDAKSKQDFYSGFLHFADENDVIHPNFNPDGARTGRFSSSDPNLQNLTAEEDEANPPEFSVRKAIVPRPGYIFIMPDYDQMEYKMFFDSACVNRGSATPLVLEVLSGKDPHQATADLVTKLRGREMSRKLAKNANFALLYGAGNAKLAKMIEASVSEAKQLRSTVLGAAPELDEWMTIIRTAATRFGYIRNWAGRRIFIPRGFEFKSPNAYVQGSCADVNKIALNRIHARLRGLRSKIVLTIHDENIGEIHESEIGSVPRIFKEEMEGAYPWKFLPLTTGMEWSDKSLGEKRKGFPI